MEVNTLDLFDLKGQVALITGGNRGLGIQMAKALADAGALTAAGVAAQTEGASRGPLLALAALEKGVVDCGITGTMSAYKASWHQVATHAYTLRVGWGLAFGAMNMDKWNALDADTQALIQTQCGRWRTCC